MSYIIITIKTYKILVSMKREFNCLKICATLYFNIFSFPWIYYIAIFDLDFYISVHLNECPNYFEHLFK